ncbi:MFS transporter [Microlunatus soli]|uniref:Predicted arabinose efflux permease, MFS family n=1 Tax=Microlunatus soli TaxID=630515 RepID=A0A1H1UDY0_9ACTN|nr:MFS transporter [Microlunatus soli]SDS70712.1 Predicted arabinose efflux permease, MFS family [Microlunatus soli]
MTITRAASRRGFWLIAIAFLITMAFTTLPTPLWPLYQQANGMSTSSVTIAFSAYAVGVLISLFLGGHVSDWVGRRPIMVAAVLAEIVAAVIFVTSTALPALLVARLISGFGIGLITATATAYLVDLHGRADADRHPLLADHVATAANLGGLGLGPIVAGILAGLLPRPLSMVYLIFIALLIIAVPMIMIAPETVSRSRRRYRPQRVSVPGGARSRYLLLGLTGFVAFALFGLFSALGPKILGSSLGLHATAITGAVSGAVFLLAVISQLVLGFVDRARQVGFGLVGLAVAFALLLTSGATGSVIAFLAGAAVGGVGAGLAFKGAMASARELAEPAVRAEAIAGMFLAAYLGLVVPVVGLGVATHAVSLDTGLAGLSVLMVLITASVLLGLGRTRVDSRRV